MLIAGELYQAVNSLVFEFARAGGGGSSSGGGGGGGSILVIIGYVPMHYTGSLIRKAKRKLPAAFSFLQYLGWFIAVLYLVVFTIWLGFVGFLIGLLGLLGMFNGLYEILGKLRPNKQTTIRLQKAMMADRAWNAESLKEKAEDTFRRYQQDWSNFSLVNMQSYLTPEYLKHAHLLMYALAQSKRQDVVSNATVLEAQIVEVSDEADNSRDQVTIGIYAQANDELIDTQTHEKLFVDNKPFTELWRFRRANDDWLLDGIQQATASAWKHSPDLEAFAAQNGYFYSLDMGWLFLPRRGYLFANGTFGKSDINNHVIGMHASCLVQLYTYKASISSSSKEYLVAQTNVPKNYGHIIVRRKKKLRMSRIKDLHKLSTEWADFNTKYEVFADDIEQVTSFELLTPTYMQTLEALPFEVNIEVVDNVIYLYAPLQNNGTTPQLQRYQAMLNALQVAFKELQL